MIRTRFAPSPTGVLHIGNARTALFNYLFTKKEKGVFVLRIEDTDEERSSSVFEKDIIENLKWLGINWDEGPYKQSKRRNIYEKYIKQLINEDKAYYCFCSQEELAAEKQYQMSIGQPTQYNQKCRNLSKKEVEKKLQENKYIIRFKTPEKKVEFNDLIRGKIEFDTKLIDDFAIAKNLQNPLYNFAVVIDDFEMDITHVIRGEDLLPNTPKQILIQEALGFPVINFAHLPVILGPDKKKMSKRHGATAIQEYKEQGYLQEALINFLAFLGWNPDSEREIYTINDLLKDFSIEKVHKAAAIFNIERLNYLNGLYIRKKNIKELTKLCLPYIDLIEPIISSEQYPPAYGGQQITQGYKIKETKEIITFEYLEKIISLYQERLKKISEITELTSYFFKKQLIYDKGLLAWKGSAPNPALDIIELKLLNIKEWTFENLEKILTDLSLEYAQSINKDKDRGYIMWPLRAALTGQKSSAGPIDIALILGKEKTLNRIKQAKK
ncbi:MAG: glutamate--tRNA ligase [Candidatus Pacebacteria bacterium]|nr:glutamate--tRNA ligase [Candidatus Paceibacterota bacterium]